MSLIYATSLLSEACLGELICCRKNTNMAGQVPDSYVWLTG
jgi:hypothetical protein